MRQADIATTLALLFASGVRAAPAVNGNEYAVRVRSQGLDSSSVSSLPQGQKQQQQQGNGDNPGQDTSPAAGGVTGGAAEAAGGLVALPGQQLTAGELQDLPGGATASVVQSSAAATTAIEMPVVVETSAAVEEVASSVSRPFSS